MRRSSRRLNSRRRVLARLVANQLLTPLDRRIGGVRAGSAGLVFALGPAGQRLQALVADELSPSRRSRQPDTPTVRFLSHQLAVSELYVEFVEQTRGTAVSRADLPRRAGLLVANE